MLGNLIKFEFMKKWQSMKYMLLGYVIIQIVLLTMIKIFNISLLDFEHNRIQGVQMAVVVIFMLLLSFIYFVPFIDGIMKYEKDLSGKQAPLELMIPARAYKKILAKLIVILVSTIIATIISIMFVILFVILAGGGDEILHDISRIFEDISKYPISFISMIISLIVVFLTVIILPFFCIAVSKSITNKGKSSMLIRVILFILILVGIGYLEIPIRKYPIYMFTVFGNSQIPLSEIIASILYLVLPFIGTSYFMDKRIEL